MICARHHNRPFVATATRRAVPSDLDLTDVPCSLQVTGHFPYACAANDPVNGVDPTGEFAILPVLAAAWAVTGVVATVADVFSATTTVLDECASGAEKATGMGLALFGLLAPGGGYGSFDEAFEASRRVTRIAPDVWKPYGRFERFDTAGNLKQVTTYDKYGRRIRQYDIGSKARHGQGYYTF